MSCEVVKLPQHGAYAIIRRVTPRPRKCSVCHQPTRDGKLCDYVVREAFEPEAPDGLTARIPAKTCDAFLCRACAVHSDPDVDYCPLHAAAKGVGGRKLRL